MGHMSASEPTFEAGVFEAEGRVSVPNPSSAVKRGPVLRDVWQRQTPPG
jgi:hypothetical protein